MNEKDLKLLKEISRERNIIPPNKTMSHKKQYYRKKKNTIEYLNELEEELLHDKANQGY